MTLATILVPLVFLIGGFSTIMALLFRNLQRLDQEAGELWQHVQEKRFVRLDAATRLLDSIAARGCGGNMDSFGFTEKIAACRDAKEPTQAAAADTALVVAWQKLSAEADLRTLTSSPVSLKAMDDLQAADDATVMAERLYNNGATIYNNAGVTFPALLVAKRAAFFARQLYRPRHATDRVLASNLDSETLADKSPRIMNAYMLWAVGMSDTTTEESEAEARPLR